MKAKAGYSGTNIKGLSASDRKILNNLEKYLAKKGLTGPPKLSISEMEAVAKKYNIDLDNLNI